MYSNTGNFCTSNLRHVTLTCNSLCTHTGIHNAGRNIPRVHRTQRVTGLPRPNLLKGNGFSTAIATTTTTSTMLSPQVRKYCPTTATPTTATIMPHAKKYCPLPLPTEHQENCWALPYSITVTCYYYSCHDCGYCRAIGYCHYSPLTTTTTATSITAIPMRLLRLQLLPRPPLRL
jgi:hypothetical protein